MLYKLHNKKLKNQNWQVESGLVGSYVFWRYSLTKKKVTLSLQTSPVAEVQVVRSYTANLADPATALVSVSVIINSL